jgi:hypothetical protein
MVYYGASREALEARFCGHLADQGDTQESVRRKISLLPYSDPLTSSDPRNDDQMSSSSGPDSLCP